MINSLAQKHPLFDPAGLFNRMRPTIHFAANKVRGYWHLLRAQVEWAEEPMPPGEPRPDSDLRRLTCLVGAEHEPNCLVVDALRVRCWVVSEEANRDAEPSLRVVPA